MSNNDEKNIVVNRGQPPANPYGSGGGLKPSRDGWTIGWGGGGGGGGGGEGGRPGTLSSSKRRRRREQDKLRREWEAWQQLEATRLESEAAARAQVEAEAQQRTQANERARVAELETAAQAEQARVVVAHQQALEALAHSYASLKAALDKKYSDAMIALPATVATEVQPQPSSNGLAGQSLLEAILHQKAQINYLVSQKSELSKHKDSVARSFIGSDPLQITNEQYKAILGSRSINAEQAYQTHQAWAQAYESALDAQLHQHAAEQLQKLSDTLSQQYAAHVVSNQHESSDMSAAKHVSAAHQLWTVVAGPQAPTHDVPSASDRAKAVAERLFTRQAINVLGRALPHLALLYPTELADSELSPSMLVADAADIGLGPDVDLAFIASRKGTVDVTYRLTLEETEGELTPAWVKTDGVTVATKVAVRAFVYNPGIRTYEFIRDGDTAPSLIWTPAVSPGNSSTFLPGETVGTSPYSGTTLSPASDTLGDYPTYDALEISELILVFPEESGLDPVYVMLKSPRYLPGVVSGVGANVASSWETDAAKRLGSSIPSEVAEALRDKKYSEFRNFKRAIWKHMSKLPAVVGEMNSKNFDLITQGKSPIVPKNERKGGRIRYEIHHVNPISAGGDVYNIDNLVITTPILHDKIHKELREQGEHQ